MQKTQVNRARTLAYAAAARRAAIALVLVTVLPSVVVAEDPAEDPAEGAAEDAAAVSFEHAWTQELGSGYSGLAGDPDHIYTMFASSGGDVLGAFSSETGDKVWSYSINPTYAGHDGSHDGPISTPQVAGDRVCGLGPTGVLFCVDRATGEAIWRVDLVEAHGAEVPFYGMSTSPLVVGDRLIVEYTAEGKSSIAAFALADGKYLWGAGSDTIAYQSPIEVVVGGKKQILAVGNAYLYGVDPDSGELLWQYEHGGDGSAIGSGSLQPVRVGSGRVLLMHKRDESKLVELQATDGGGVEVAEVWSSPAIKNTYAPPVYDSGHLYGYSNRFLTCVDAETGEMVWRSREPGDGFVTALEGKLAILTKMGTLHLVEMNPEGYEEWSRLELFDDAAWTAPTIAGGRLYARSLGEIARVDLSRLQRRPTSPLTVPEGMETSFFMMVIGGVLKSGEPGRLLDGFWKSVDITPLREGADFIHFVYRGEAEDLSLVSDLTGSRHEEPMNRIPQSNFFYYSRVVDPAARFSYHFVKDFEEAIVDPLNPNTFEIDGETRNWYAMPDFVEPPYLSATPERVGSVARIEVDYSAFEGSTPADVYLPHGYAEKEERYPVVYIHDGGDAMEEGGLVASLDALIESGKIEPLIGVFIHEPEADREDPLEQRWDRYATAVSTELVAEIDKRFRTRSNAASRASLAAGWASARSLYTAVRYESVFSGVAMHSVYMLDSAQKVIDPLLPEAAEGATTKALNLYMDWGLYDPRVAAEAWDMPKINRAFADRVRAAGYDPAGGDVPQGGGWHHWKTRVGDSLALLFPVATAAGSSTGHSTDR